MKRREEIFKKYKTFIPILLIMLISGSFLYFQIPSDASMMPYLKIIRVKTPSAKINPLSSVWSKSPYIEVPLDIQTKSIKKVELKGMIVKNTLYIRLKWHDLTKNVTLKSPNQFYDGCAVSFPIKKSKGYEPSVCMGQINNEVNIWHWRANMANHKADNLIAGGPGTLTSLKDPYLHQIAKWENGYWYVEFYKPLSDKNSVTFKPNKKYYMSVAIWNGSDNERAMMKSVSNWVEVKTE